MEEIKKQVSRARRRLVFQQFVGILTWSTFSFLLIAAVAIAIPKLWALEVSSQVWANSWLGGALALGLVTSIIWTLFVCRSELEAAIELDRRFGLKERISSAMSMDLGEVDSGAGQALMSDAVRRVARLDVGEKFRMRPTWKPIIPLLTAAIVFVVAVFVPDAVKDQQANASTTTAPGVKRQIHRSAEELKKKLEQKKKEAAEKGLAEAGKLFDELQKGVDDLSKRDDVDRKKAMLKINDLAKDLAERRKQLGDMEKMKEQLDQLKNIQKGPADKLADAMKDGNFKKAMDEVSKLQEKMRTGKLSEAEKKELAEQLDQMRQKMSEMADRHEQAKRDLKDMIAQKKREGDLASAGDLQRKLDKMNSMDQQMNQMKQMANQMAQAAKAMQQGDSKQAADQLDQLAQQLDQMQAQFEELETLTEAMDQIADAKAAMGCQECQGEGCPDCQGNSFAQNNMRGQQPGGYGMNEGQGRGDRPEEETDTGGYKSRVVGKPRKGEAANVGEADGPNLPGESLELIKAEVTSSFSEDEDPLVNVRLPRRERDHLREYFERLRKGD